MSGTVPTAGHTDNHSRLTPQLQGPLFQETFQASPLNAHISSNSSTLASFTGRHAGQGSL